MKTILIHLVLFAISATCFAQKVLVPMDKAQTDHLKAYGVAYWCLERSLSVEWLLNYRGGSFMMDALPALKDELTLRGVSFEEISTSKAEQILAQIRSEESNMDVMRLDKAPKIVVYVPPTNLPWDDAVTLVLTYAEIPYDKVWDEEVLKGKLKDYDWLHVHHEDFTGQYGKFYAQFRNAPWYIKQVRDAEQLARRLGYSKVSEQKKPLQEKFATLWVKVDLCLRCVLRPIVTTSHSPPKALTSCQKNSTATASRPTHKPNSISPKPLLLKTSS
jgi:hypothetical protein